ncbi:FKBP-type peptidyl-prolyl cis-trans isomerase [Flavobacterium aquidurense]|uniref:peptidylprolyl isomerase n=1 Tax=Flavobacterium aquidurense TaxID=362413 RepID=A0A0Q1BPQ1_9FLAO|nr:FKBP-type peptidyl-prolyl cis-trans isomerase [Flavobacterium aquidurense]KQB42975.1 Peptidyl-prolyl cis-trans isomerase [Flavobacterium aquidurense]
MNKFKYYFILLLAGISLVSCNKSDDDNVVTVPLRDYAVQYKADNDSIEKYLKTNYITVTNSPGTPQDQDVVIKKIVAGDGNVSIWDQGTYKLTSRNVYSNDITYKVYYLILREGTGSAPTNTDKIVASYTGNLLNNTVFDSSYGIGTTFNLFPYSNEGSVIEGWSEIFPKFKTGSSTTDPGSGVISYKDFGAGVMFLPSGLAYYADSKGTIPSYSPIVFSFKLFDLQRMDNEYTISASTGGRVFLGDGVPDYLEDINGDGYLYDFRDKTKYPNPPAELVDDTDKDGVADFVDFDDDGDGFTTRFELTKPTSETGIVNGFNYGARLYYPWEPLVDNPNTPNTDETEPRGIPRRPTGALADPTKPESATNVRKYIETDYTDNPRLRIHLDNTYPIKQN